jgi:hypothetical protein
MPMPRDHAACYQFDGYGYTAGLGEQHCDQNEDLHGTGLAAEQDADEGSGSVTRPTATTVSVPPGSFAGRA